MNHVYEADNAAADAAAKAQARAALCVAACEGVKDEDLIPGYYGFLLRWRDDIEVQR